MNSADRLLGEAALARFGERAALYCGEDSLSYRALAERVQRAAGALASYGVGRGDRVMLLMRDSPALAVAWLGCLWRGAVAIALNDKLSEDDYRFIRADCDARLVIVEDRLRGVLPSFAAELARAGRLVLTESDAGLPAWNSAAAASSPMTAALATQPDDAAFWLYSSGTTGRPKGIIHAHKDIDPAGEVFRAVVGLKPGDKVLATSRLFFSYGLEHALLGPLAMGASAVLDPDWSDVHTVVRVIAKHAPVAVFSVPSVYRRLIALGAGALQPLRGVRFFFAAGERLPESTVAEWRRLVDREILSIYGTSETLCVVMVTPAGTSNGTHTGLPLRGVEVRLLAADGSAVPRGEPGVLWIKHPSLTTGYVNRAELTEEQFRDGWFCSKDVFVRDAEGYYRHQGRADDLIKVSGQWVRPDELEEVVLAAPAIAEAACVPVVDSEGFERLALFVVPRNGAERVVETARAACEERLPKHKRPKWIRAVAELPRTLTGKVQRFKLRAQLERELGAER
jgi:benzoate-CoA ligase